jgi:predicted glycosyltransferase involved in capsule biosynthesis
LTAYKAGDEYDMFIDAAAYQGALLFNPTRFFYTGGNRNFYGYYNADLETLIDISRRNPPGMICLPSSNSSNS